MSQAKAAEDEEEEGSETEVSLSSVLPQWSTIIFEFPQTTNSPESALLWCPSQSSDEEEEEVFGEVSGERAPENVWKFD